MCRRILALCALLALVTGCPERERALLVAPPTSGPIKPPGPTPKLTSAPANEDAARRVLTVGRKLLDANKQAGMRPLFQTVGAPEPEIFHRGTGQTGYRIIVTEGLVRECRTDETLAAVLAMELGKMVSERETGISPSIRQPDPRPPINVPVGNDTGGHYGSSDATRLAELAKFDKRRPLPGTPPPLPPPPEKLAASYLQRAGYSVEDLERAQPILLKADRTYNLEKSMKEAGQ